MARRTLTLAFDATELQDLLHAASAHETRLLKRALANAEAGTDHVPADRWSRRYGSLALRLRSALAHALTVLGMNAHWHLAIELLRRMRRTMADGTMQADEIDALLAMAEPVTG